MADTSRLQQPCHMTSSGPFRGILTRYNQQHLEREIVLVTGRCFVSTIIYEQVTSLNVHHLQKSPYIVHLQNRLLILSSIVLAAV